MKLSCLHFGKLTGIPPNKKYIITYILTYLIIYVHNSAISEDVKSVSSLLPESIVEIVARSLWLISQGELKVSLIFIVQ
jgi:hypothetical protein